MRKIKPKNALLRYFSIQIQQVHISELPNAEAPPHLPEYNTPSASATKPSATASVAQMTPIKSSYHNNKYLERTPVDSRMAAVF